MFTAELHWRHPSAPGTDVAGGGCGNGLALWCAALPRVRQFGQQAAVEGGAARLLLTCRSGNAGRGVTGALLYQESNVMQVLEGDRRVVEALYQVILRDRRHR